MRPELSQLERIEQYLNGEMDSVQTKGFENELMQNSELRELLGQQKDLIRAAKRKALRAQIESVAAAGGGAGGSSISGSTWLTLGGITVIGLTIGAYFIWGSEAEDTDETDPSFIVQHQQDNQYSIELDSTKTKMEMTMDDDNRLFEEPETIFSSVSNYKMEESLEEETLQETEEHKEAEKRSDEDGNSNNSELKTRVIKTRSQPRNEIEVDAAPEYENKASRASFPGGNVDLKAFMDKHLRYPKSAYDKGIEAVIRCDFQITGDGLIQNINADLVKMSEEDGMPFSDVRQLFNMKLTEAFIGNATHVLRIMPTWEPATNSAGTPIMSTQRMYFSYDLQRGCLAYQLSDDFEVPVGGEED